ncbi:hypothetical protein [Candidatus Amarolinea dominans]
MMEHGRLVGIISHTDLMRAFDELETPSAESAA